MARPEYEAIVKIVYSIDNSEMKKVTEPTKGKTVTINVDADSKNAEKDIKKLKTDLNELKKIVNSAGDGADFTKIVKQLDSAIKEINVLSRAMKNLQSDSVKPIGLDIDVIEIQKIMNFAKTFESGFESVIEGINNRINGLVESIGNIKPPDISVRKDNLVETADGQLSFFEEIKSGTQEAKSSIQQLDDAIDNLSHRDSVDSSFDGEQITIDEYIKSLDELKKKKTDVTETAVQGSPALDADGLGDETSALDELNAKLKAHAEIVKMARDADAEKLDISQKLAKVLEAEGKAAENTGKKHEDSEKKKAKPVSQIQLDSAEIKVGRQEEIFKKLDVNALGYDKAEAAMTSLNQALANLKNAKGADEQRDKFDKLNVLLKDTKDLMNNISKTTVDSSANKEFIQNLSDIEKRAKNLSSQKIINDEQFSAAKSELALINTELEKIKSAGVEGKEIEKTITSFEKAQFAVGKYSDNVKKAEANIHKLNGEFEHWIRNSSAAVKDSKFGPMIEDIRKMGIEFEKSADPEKAAKFANAVSMIKSEVRGAGLNVASFSDLVSKTFTRLGSYLISQLAYRTIRGNLQTLYKNVVDIDFAMRDLERISGATGSQLTQTFEEASEKAIQLGTSIKGILESTAEWSRLGMSIEDSMKMAESTALLATAGVMSIDKATEGLISTTRAYSIAAEDTLALVDKIVAADVSQAISSEGILDVLQRSSASLKAANSSLEENIALGVAMNSVLQDAEKTGTSLNTMAMRIRNTTGALQEMGEETDSTFESITQLQQRVYELTNQKVDIFINEDTFDSIYNIIQGISQEWSNMSDKAQAELTQILGGTRQAQSISSLISQFQLAEDAMVSMGQSAGKALELNNIIMDTATKKAEQLGASFEKFSEGAFDSSIIKLGLDGLRGLVTVLDAVNRAAGGLPTAALGMGAVVGSIKALDAKSKFDSIKNFVKDIGKQAA